ncbi:adenylate cyclase [[Synechococcus] sp. NIES-970]|uniref:adenylate/guanylate cyclase domain-containing protein n=1 Tax=Picosynechococcus sp. NKBG15041c TaxID=1407650 RepID=UPI000424BA3A|nr:adenylate/guanylate cyclase domain-containing protein [Picosynechococcus sp. NKBG15041c]BAW97133.1 adenylate cyclase [[Synechococcus] sp. NIES-970]
MTDLQLRIQAEGYPERIVVVDQGEFVIGRLPECSLTLQMTQISRYHARIKQVGTTWILEDLGSTNGTYLNHVRISDPQPIRQGDLIRLGVTSILVTFQDVTLGNGDATELNFGQSGDGRTILRSAEALKEQWLQGEEGLSHQPHTETAIARLKELVDIAKQLSSAESIEAIFRLTRGVVFQELPGLERLALLIDVRGNGKLELLSAAAQNLPDNHPAIRTSAWISQSVCQKVFREKLAIKSVDAQSDQRFAGEDSILAKGIRGVLAVPLWDQAKVVGVLYGDAHLKLDDSEPLAEDDLSFFSTIGHLLAASVQRWLLGRRLQEQAQIRQKLERYHSPAVVHQLISVGALKNGRLPPKEADISILFADIVGFTAIAEQSTPSEIADLLNVFFEEMLHSVFGQGGTLDKFIGDCIMAFFGAPEPQVDHAERAIAAAMGMLNRLEQLNLQKIWPQPIQLRIAVNSGKAFVGDVGSTQRVDYTVLGATVNLAARIETICPPGECVITDATYQAIRHHQDLFTPMGEGRFKGIDRLIQVYRTQRHRHTQSPCLKSTETYSL